MAITATLLSASSQRIKFLLDQDGAAGTTVTISNAALQAALVGVTFPSELLSLLQATYASQAAARAALSEGVRCGLMVTPRSTAAAAWAVDINVAATLAVINVIGPAADSEAVLELVDNHSIIR